MLLNRGRCSLEGMVMHRIQNMQFFLLKWWKGRDRRSGERTGRCGVVGMLGNLIQGIRLGMEAE